MTTRPEKHSVTLHGHRTSVSLERPFWEAFRDLAEREALPLNVLVAKIDDGRGDLGLASAIRLYVLDDLQKRLNALIP